MQKAQVFLRDDQRADLAELARQTGSKQSELIRRGVDLVIAAEKQKLQDWKETLDEMFGVWRDRPEMEEEIASIRQDLKRRSEKTGI